MHRVLQDANEKHVVPTDLPCFGIQVVKRCHKIDTVNVQPESCPGCAHRAVFEGNRPVAHAMWQIADACARGHAVPLGMIGLVYTDPAFRGRGFALEPMYGDWETSWESLHLQGYLTDTDLITVVTVPAYDYLYFQQYLESQKREGILISATLSTYPDFHREGVMKID